MSFADAATVHAELVCLQAHHAWAYPALFLGAWLETVVPFSLFVPGEIVFLAAAVLAATGTLELPGVLAVLYSGGVLGDNCSYWIGRRCGQQLFRRLAGWPLLGPLLRRSGYETGVAFFRRRGALAVFLARLSGPLSAITPALAGMFRLNYRTFLCCNTPAVLIGISEFVFAGYFLAHQLPSLRTPESLWGAVFGLGVVLLTLAHRLRRRSAAASRSSSTPPSVRVSDPADCRAEV